MNYLDDYLLYCTHTESPPKYHLWCGLSVLSHLAGRRVWMDNSGLFTARLNMYIALVGDPGLKKSTAMRLASKLVQSVDKDIIVAPDSITREALIKLMGEEDSKTKRTFQLFGKPVQFRQVSVFADEFVILINSGGNPFGMIELLTGMWDTDMYRDSTKNKGSYDVPNPYIPILGCLTTDTVKQLMTNKVLTSGMSRRVLFVFADKNGPAQPRPFISPEQAEARDRCTAHVRAIQSVVGEFHWSPATIPLWDKWYLENYERIESRRDANSGTINFLNTKPLYVTKVAMLLALCDYTTYNQKVIEPTHFLRALQLVTDEELGAAQLFEGAGRTELGSVMKDVEAVIKRAGPKGITLGLLRHSVMQQGLASPQEIDQILNVLTGAGKLESILVGNNGSQKPGVVLKQ